MTKDVEHFFRCFSTIQVSSVENSLFSSVFHFLIGSFDCLEFNFLSSLYILDIIPLFDVGLVKIFHYLLVAVLSYWQYPLPYRSFAILWSPICWFLILEHKTLFCSGTFPLCPCTWGFFPLTLLLVSGYLVLCGGPWSTGTWALYKEVRVGRYAFFYMLTASWTNTICLKCCLFSTGWF